MKPSSLSLLIKRQFKENYQAYAISVAVLLGLLAFLFLLVHQWRDSFSGAVQNGVFLIGLFISGGVFTNTMFQELSEPSKGMWLLNIPATQAEKVVAAILMSTVAFLSVYLCLFFLVDGVYVRLTYKSYGTQLMDLFKNDFHHFIFTYLKFNGIILLGSIFFTKHSFIKTLLVIILGIVFLNYFNNWMIESMIPDMTVTSSGLLSSFQFVYQGENVYVNLPDAPAAVISFCEQFILPLLLWGIAWLRLKEKEI